MERDRLVQIDIEPDIGGKAAKPGDIFVGKVKDIVPNIQAAFVEIANRQRCYLSMEKLKQPIFLNSKKNGELHQGDEILVQVSREAVKTKPADVTANINITGRYVILTYGKTIIGISGRIKEETERKRLRQVLEPYKNQEYGFILRTNAVYATEEEIHIELNSLIEQYKNIRKKAEYSTCFSCISRAPEHFITDLRDNPKEKELEIITDNKEVYFRLKDYLKNFQPENSNNLHFYEDPMISLWNLYGLETKLDKALHQKVWLPCGGYLIIEPTEALTVIDVNSGKSVGKKKDTEAAYYKVNVEAAKEIAIQIRLRNLSGIIIVDFIDMKKENKDSFIPFFARQLAQDPIKTNFIDMTALHLAEITRKKVRKPLYEQMQLFQVKDGEKG